MGVYELETYIERFIKNGIIPVNIEVEIEKFKKWELRIHAKVLLSSADYIYFT